MMVTLHDDWYFGGFLPRFADTLRLVDEGRLAAAGGYVSLSFRIYRENARACFKD
jgi:hypothetical protein